MKTPKADISDQGGDYVGRLNRKMYGFMDIASGWCEDWKELLSAHNYTTCIADPALFYNAQRGSRGAAHGDDFYVLGRQREGDDMTTLLKSEYGPRETHRLGFSQGCVQDVVILSRVVKLGRDESGRKFVHVGLGARHAPRILKTSGLTNKSSPTTVPGVKFTDVDLERRLPEPALNRADTSAYRPCVMRAAFLAQDRADMGEATKTLTRPMSPGRQVHGETLNIVYVIRLVDLLLLCAPINKLCLKRAGP